MNFREIFNLGKDGKLRHKESRRSIAKDAVAGSVGDRGYVVVRYKGARYYAHRVVWEMTFGPIPPNMKVLHKSFDRTDNRPSNLRLGTSREVQFGRRKSTRNTSDVKGVYWHNRSRKWCAQIGLEKGAKWLGSFEKKEDAKEAYRKAALKHYGKFAKLDQKEVA